MHHVHHHQLQKAETQLIVSLLQQVRQSKPLMAAVAAVAVAIILGSVYVCRDSERRSRAIKVLYFLLGAGALGARILRSDKVQQILLPAKHHEHHK